MRTMHLFAGAGGGLLADLILGHTPVAAVEWEPYACQVLRDRAADGWFPELSVYEGDVRLFNPSEYAGRIHTLHAGFPTIKGVGQRASATTGGGGLFDFGGVIRMNYEREERIAIRMDSGMTEREAIRLTDAVPCEAIARLNVHHAQVMADKAAKWEKKHGTDRKIISSGGDND